VASEKIKKHIKSKMQWDGTPDVVAFPPRGGGPREPVGKAALQQWAQDWNEFGRRVRRDILVLEKLLVDKGLIDKADLYGDPGDPPPDPDI
jgi:hypothetical protein